MSLGVLAHQGGWDEALLVAAPVLLFAALVWQAKRRATRQSHEANGDTGADAPARDAHGSDTGTDTPARSERGNAGD